RDAPRIAMPTTARTMLITRSVVQVICHAGVTRRGGELIRLLMASSGQGISRVEKSGSWRVSSAGCELARGVPMEDDHESPRSEVRRRRKGIRTRNQVVFSR